MVRNYAIILIAVLSFLSYASASPAVVIEENGVDIQPLSQRSSLRNVYEGQEFATSYELRQKRRMGVGLQIAGISGLYGAFAELNFNPSNSGVFGFGGGPGFSSFHGSWKYLFAEGGLSPYAGLGYAHWYDAGATDTHVRKSNPGFLSNSFLSQSERNTRKFQMDLAMANLGVQYHILQGPYAGLSFFAEIDGLLRLSAFAFAPTGSVGTSFYF